MQARFVTVLARVIGTGPVSSLRMWLRSAKSRCSVRESRVKIALSDFDVFDRNMFFPELNVNNAPTIVYGSPHFTDPTWVYEAG
ncbi:MAG: hypothetical protein R8G34_01570 [Paracoccaceae bacterium]|nr:hypothetical protein [Paracoccaceae bacterium]